MNKRIKKKLAKRQGYYHYMDYKNRFNSLRLVGILDLNLPDWHLPGYYGGYWW